MIQTNIVFLKKDDQILLAMKKRGHGVGKWNGVGGKAATDETAEQAAIRETQEEIGVTPQKLELVGELVFLDDSGGGLNQDCKIFITESWIGEPVESEEMKPQWFSLSSIPSNQMWAADKIWLPLLLEGQKFTGEIIFNGDKLISQEINEVASLPE